MIRSVALAVLVGVGACSLACPGTSTVRDAGGSRGDTSVGSEDSAGGDLGSGSDQETADLAPAGRVFPYGQCAASGPRAVFLAEIPPPATLSPGQRVGVSVSFANCSGKTWNAVPLESPSGYKLGAQAPQDNQSWGASRIRLPADVPHDEAVEIGFTITAPTLPGAVGYRWAILEESVAWITDEMSPLHTIEVQAAVRTVELCPGVQVELGGKQSALAGLQQCIEATASGGMLELPAGIYLITGVLTIAKPITLRTAGTAASPTACLLPGAPPCAILRADASLAVDRGFFQIIAPASKVTIDHLVLDGNRGARLGSAAAANCPRGNTNGFNAIARGDGHTFSHNASVNTLCGTAMEWRGHSSTIKDNLFENNGDHTTAGLWADGLTIHEANDSVVSGNILRNNSDVDLILGGGTNTVVTNNTIAQTTQAAFAGLMLDNFNAATPGDYRGTKVTANTVSCTALLCDFGINLGPHPWYLPANVFGGEVTGNTVSNAKICLNIDGAGTAEYPIKVHGNTLSGSPSQAAFNCGTRATSNFNIGPDSVVDLAGDVTPHTSTAWHQCP